MQLDFTFTRLRDDGDMRNTSQLADAIAQHFMIGTGIACVLITAAGDHSRLSVNDASAHGAEGRRLWFGSQRLAQRALSRLLSADRRTAKARDGLVMATSIEEAEKALIGIVTIHGLAKTFDAEIAERFATMTTRIAAFIAAGGLKKLNREYQALASPARAASRQANQTAHARAQEVFAALPDAERAKLKSEFAIAKAANPKASWTTFLASVWPELETPVLGVGESKRVADVPAYEMWLMDRIGPQIAAMAGSIGRLPE
ncbi:hypothetical protein [Bradyrhizobium sp. F1.13.3]|uniref:hypothetical protein n=1 Tax=Bradyrhizobium sp. F1.13.3 TaxID=3156351 RepID=UPI0033995E4B